MATFDGLPKGVFNFKSDAQRADAAFPFGLGQSGVHEICEQNYGDFPALFGFALSTKRQRPGAIFHVQQARLGLEYGAILQAGMMSAFMDMPKLLRVEVQKLSAALWSIEEAIKSSAVALVIAEIESCDFTASRRLVLASSRYGVPVILLMPHSHAGASAAQARWRLSTRVSANNRFDTQGLGAPRWCALLERSRQMPHLAGQSFDLEWNDETLSLTMVPGLAPDPASQGAAETTPTAQIITLEQQRTG